MRPFRRILAGTLVVLGLAALAACSSNDSVTATPATLATPTGVSVTPGDNSCTVQWNVLQGATSYNIYWSNTSPVTKTTGTKIAGAPRPYTHTGLTNGVAYYYVVTAVYPEGESAESAQVSATPSAPVPGAPANLSGVPGDQSAVLLWGPVSGAISYNLYYATAANVVPGAAGVTKVAGITDTSKQVTGLTNGTPYYFVATAVTAAGEGPLSNEVAVTPAAPTAGAPQNVTANAGNAQVTLAWSPVSGANSYTVYWSTSAFTDIHATGVTPITGINEVLYVHSGLVNGTTYYYRITATSSGVEGSASAQVSARPLPPPPPPPLGVTAIVNREESGSSVTIQWYDSPGATGYNIYRGTEPGVATYYHDITRATKIANVTAPYLDTDVVAGTTYYYVVTAYVPLVEGLPSTEVSALIQGSGSGGGGGGGGDTGFGNNLSFPLVYADGYGITGAKITGAWPGIGPFTPPPAFDYNTGLRPLSTETIPTFPYFDNSTAVTINQVTYFPQATASTWQAQWQSNTDNAVLDVVVDWGDALVSKTYTVNSIVRIETVLYQDASTGFTDNMVAYKMTLLSGSQDTELQGTDNTTYIIAKRNVFAVNAHLTIEKLALDNTTVEALVYDKSVYGSFGTAEEGGGSGGGGGSTGGGSGAYAGELNVGGSVVYGYNFALNKITLPTGISKTGTYRLTFQLDPEATIGTGTPGIPNHVRMVGKADAAATLDGTGTVSTILISVQ
jgi:hypothetical protein